MIVREPRTESARRRALQGSGAATSRAVQKEEGGGWLWLQLLIGWLPIWALYSTLIYSAHAGTSAVHAGIIGIRAIVAAAVLGLAVRRLAERLPWPHPFRLWFVAVHVLAAMAYGTLWVALTSAIESVLRWRIVLVAPAGLLAFLVLGGWLYLMVAGAAYTMAATQRAARAEGLAARAQLGALRAQLHPHFLFNALHTVVHLIPREPRRAAEAAEQLAGLLRTTIEEDRDLISLDDELGFVERYLELERLRFGDRLKIALHVDEEARDAVLPSFAVQTLVENAVRHGAAPKVEATEIDIVATVRGALLTVTVRDTGVGVADERLLASSNGTGLTRLRERLTVLYGRPASLAVARRDDGGIVATLVIPQLDGDVEEGEG